MHQVTTWLVVIMVINYGGHGDGGEYSSEVGGQYYHG